MLILIVGSAVDPSAVVKTVADTDGVFHVAKTDAVADLAGLDGRPFGQSVLQPLEKESRLMRQTNLMGLFRAIRINRLELKVPCITKRHVCTEVMSQKFY